MPTPTMRNKLQETKCLRVCQKSNAIAKRSCSHLEIHQSAAKNCPTTQTCKDVYPICQLNAHDTGTVGNTNCEEFVGGEDMQFKKLRTCSDDCAVIEHMELPVASCSKNLETIFSPTLGETNVGNPYTSTEVCIDQQDSFNFCMADESDGNSGSSSDYQTCDFSDFYISEMVLASLQFDGVYICDDIAETLVFPEFDTAESNIFDVLDQRMSLPFLGDLSESSESLDARSSEEARLDCDNSDVLLAIHQICPGDQEIESRPCFDSDDAQYLDPQSFIRNLPDLSDMANEQLTFLPKESRERTVTLVLDLDETLVHSTLEYCQDADFTFTIFFNMKESTVYVKERPHLRTFLTKAAELFEVIVFTASQSIYAEKLLDILDPDGQFISGRAYRESCIFVDGSYTKDLTVLGLDLAKVMIIDNSPQVFRLQVNNGIPIKSWFDDPSDNELISLLPFLETLSDVVDVRPIIAERFGNKE